MRTSPETTGQIQYYTGSLWGMHTTFGNSGSIHSLINGNFGGLSKGSRRYWLPGMEFPKVERIFKGISCRL